MAFDAAEEVAELEFNFDSLAQKYRHPDGSSKYPALEGVKGVTDEPSDDDIEAFQKAMAAAVNEAIPDGVDPTDQAAVAKASRNMPDGQFKKVQDAIVDAVSQLTKGSPSREQITALPFRHKRRYIQSLQQDLLNPEGAAAATSS